MKEENCMMIEFRERFNNIENYHQNVKYDDGIGKIYVSYPSHKTEFNLKDEDELKEFIKTINVLYGICDDERFYAEYSEDEINFKLERVIDKIYEYKRLDETVKKLVEEIEKII